MTRRDAHRWADVRNWTILLTMAFALVACGGGSGGGLGADGPPAAPTGGSIPATANNPQNVVNGSNEAGVYVRVTFGPESSSENTVTATIGDEATGPFASAQSAAPDGTGNAKVGPIDMSSMPDGSYPLTVEVTGPGGSSGQISFGSVLKDTVFYRTPVTSFVAASPTGPQPNGTAMDNVVNAVNVSNATVTTTWGADADSSLSFVVEITDSRGQTITSNSFQAPEGAGTADATGIDCSSLEDGALAISVRVTDPGGNVNTFSGTAATKDTEISSALLVSVPQTGNNPADFINAASQSQTQVDVLVPATFSPSDTITVTLTDGSNNTVTAGPQTPQFNESGPTSQAIVSFQGIDASGLDEGLISIAAEIRDPNGNLVTYPGTGVVKDTIIGQATSTIVAAGPNNPIGIINIASQTQVYVDVALDAGAAVGDQVTVHCESFGRVFSSAPQAVAAAGAGTVQVGPTDTNQLADGNINVWATISDAAGNTWTGGNSVADKGTVAPTTPAYVRVNAGAGNAQNVVNSSNVSSVTVEAQVGSGNDPSRTITFHATDGITSISQTLPAPTGGATITWPGIDFAGLLEGSFTLEAWTTDGFANPSTFFTANPLKDTISVASPTTAYVAGSGQNPQGYINANTASATQVFVGMPNPWEIGGTWNVTITDSASGTASSTTLNTNANGPGATVTIDTSALADGNVTISVNTSDAAGNLATYASWSAVKDTQGAGNPSFLGVAQGTDNAAHVINGHNVTQVTVRSTFGTGALGGGEQFTVELLAAGTDTVLVRQGPVAGAAIGGTTYNFAGMNTTRIPDGGVDIRLIVEDAAGNMTILNGTQATKDTVAPAVATSAIVPAGGSNPQDFINLATWNNAQVDVGLGASSVATDQVTLRLIAAQGQTISAGPVAATAGAGTLNFTSLNTISQSDGPMVIEVTIEDVNGNTSVFHGSCTKDTAAPAAPTMAGVSGSKDNPQDVINGATANAAIVAVTLPGGSGYDGTEQVDITLTGGATATASFTAPFNGGATATPVNASALTDGAVTVSVDVTDTAGNVTNFVGTAATKDVVAPTAPTSMAIPISAMNPANVINNQTHDAVQVDIVYDVSMVGDETATLRLRGPGDSDPATLTGPVAVPATGGPASISGIDARRLNEGTVQIEMTLSDPSWNRTVSFGTVATKDTVGPDVPTLAQVWMTGANPTNYINNASQNAVQVNVGFGPGSVATDVATVTLVQGASTIAGGTQPAPAGAGTLSFPAINASTLADGNVLVQVDITDPNLNLTTFFGTTAIKDVVAPAAYTSANIIAGSNNAQDVINSFNVGLPQMNIVFPASYAGDETYTVDLTDTAPATVSSGSHTAPAGGGAAFTNLPSVAGLLDGTLTVQVNVQDPAGNTASFSTGTNPTKDTTPAAAPASINVPMTGSSPVNVINNQTHTAVVASANFDASSIGDEQATLTFRGMGMSGGSITRSVRASAVPAGGGATSFPAVDLSAFADGTVSLELEIIDGAGNPATFAGTAATKDTAAPAVPTFAQVWMTGANPTNYINNASQTAVQVDVGFGASSVATDTVTVTLVQGASMIAGGSQSAPAGAGTLSFPAINASTLADGNVLVQVDITDPNLNLTTFFGTTAIKDVVAPAAYTSANIIAGSNNAQDVINSFNVGLPQMNIVFPASYAGDETYTVDLTDTAPATVSSGSHTAPAGGGAAFTNLPSVAGLLDGTLTVQVNVQDPAGNTASFSTGTNPTKDTTPAAAPASINVPMTGSSPVNVINNQTHTAVVASANFDASSIGDEQATLTFRGMGMSGGSITRSVRASAVPAGGGATSFPAVDLSAFADGSINLELEIIDGAGNPATFYGTSATKDTVGPDVPTLAQVWMTGANPTNYINAASQAAVQVNVGFGPNSLATDTATVTLVQGGSMIGGGSQSAPAGTGTLTYTAINASTLADGNVIVQVDLTDANQNVTTFLGTTAIKDVVAPAPYTSANIAAEANNAADIINSFNVTSPKMNIVFPASYVGDETIDVSLTDTAPASVSRNGNTAPAGGGSLLVAFPNASALLDGTLTVQVTATDPAGNQSVTSAGTNPTKDTTPAVAPSSIAIAMTGSNPANVINNQTVTAVVCDVNFDASMVGDEEATLTYRGTALAGGSIERSIKATAVPGGGGVYTFPPVNLSAFADGTVNISCEIIDGAGNPATFYGTAALKDTVAPPVPTMAFVPMGGSNPANFINAATVSSFQVDVTYDGTADATATATVTVEDGGGNPVVSGSQACNPSSTVTYGTLNGTLLVEGSHVIRVDLVDPNLNTATYVGTAVVKDTMAPTNPSLLQVAMGTGNAVNVINLNNYTSVTMDVTYDGSMVGDETAQVTLTSGASAMSSSVTVPASGGAATIGGINTTGLTEGTNVVAMSITITDPAGNSSTYNAGGTMATMDITPPAAPTAAQVVDSGASVNPANYINGVSHTQVRVDTTMAAGAAIGDQVALTLGGPGGMMLSPTAFTLTSAGVQTVTFSGMDASLFMDGSVSLVYVITDPNGNTTPFTGTAATKDTVAPAMPTFAGIAATPNNPVNWVNLASSTQVEVSMTFGSGSVSTDIVTLNITDSGVGSMNYGPTNATDGVGNLVFVNQDFSGLADGALTVNVTMSDLAGNTANSLGNAAMKDVIPPTAPTGYNVAAGGQNAIHVVNSFSVNAVQLDVNYGGTPAGDETVNFSVTSDGGGKFSLGPITPAASAGIVMYSGNDFAAAGVLDGNLTLAGSISDPAGNIVPFTGTAAVQDTTSPVLPSAAFVAMGGSNAQDVINSASENAVTVTTTFGTFDPSDQVTVTLRDSMNNTVSSGPISSGASIDFTGIDTSGGALVEGSIAVEISIQDANGNPASMFTGTAAIKDITAPDPASSGNVLAGAANNADWVSNASQGAANIRIVLPGTYVATDTIDVTIDDNVLTIMAMQQNAPAGGGNVDITGLDLSSLGDGQIDINVTTTDQYGNSQTQLFNADKDVVAPASVTAAQIAAGATNPADYINAVSQTGIVVDVTYDGTAHMNDRATVTLTGGASVTSMEITAAASSVVSTPGFDGTSMTDGPITVTVNMYDLAGNTGSFSGTTGTKDVVVPQPAIVDPMPSPVNATAQSVSGVAEIGNTVEIIVASTPVAMAATNSLGSFVIPWTVPTDATTTFEIRATDAAGNPQATDTTVDWNSTTLQVVHDSTGPDIGWTDNTVASNLGDTGSASGGSFIDVDNDGDLDCFISSTNKLWRNDGAGVFTDVTVSLGVIFVGDRSAVWGDYDNDGDLDLFTTHSTLGSFLWQNDLIPSGTLSFSDASGPSGAAVGGQLRGAAWFDYNNDGWLDVMSADQDMLGNELLRNDGTSTFTSIFGSGLDPAITSPNWVVVGDLDSNGGIDLVIGDVSPSLQYMNNGSGAFTDTAGVGGSGFVADTSTTNGGIAMGDLDNDGDLDMIVASGGAAGVNQFWQNDGTGNFTDVAATAGCDTAANAYDVVLADFDNDGLLDIYFACNGANVLYRNQGDQVGADGIPEFVNIAAQAGGVVNDASDGRLAAAGDVDGDGDIDVLVGNEAVANVMYRNDLGNNYRYLMVNLVGKGGALLGSSTDAIGAQVRMEDAESGANLMWRWVNGGRGAGADDPKSLHFGGIAPSRPYHLHVTWPNGSTQSLMNVIPAIQPNQTVTIVEQ